MPIFEIDREVALADFSNRAPWHIGRQELAFDHVYIMYLLELDLKIVVFYFW